MKYFRIFFLPVLINLSGTLAFGQTNRISVTVAAAQYPDTINRPTVVVVDSALARDASQPGTNVHHESMTVMPVKTLSVGKASAVSIQKRQNSTAAPEKTTVNYSEQKVEKNEVPANNATITPK